MLVSISRAAVLIGVCCKTLRRWHQKGYLIPDSRIIGGHRRYSVENLIRFTKSSPKRKTRSSKKGSLISIRQFQNAAVYARVSTAKQKEDLRRQIEFLTKKAKPSGFKHVLIYKDIASGLNDKRMGLKRLIRDAFARKYSTIFITHADRLARFGKAIIYQALDLLNVEIRDRDAGTSGSETPPSPTDELVNDVLAILTSYSGKLYRLRRGTFS